MPDQSSETFICPNCGENVAEGSLSCPHCGSDDETGWSAEAEYDELDLPTGYRDEDLVDEGMVPESSSFSKDTLWPTVAIVLLFGIVILVVLKAF